MSDTLQELERIVADWSGINLLRTLADGETPGVQDLEDYGLDAGADVFEALDYVALEVYGNERHQSSGHQLTSVTIVTGIGGPHVETQIMVGGTAYQRAYWGGDTRSATAHGFGSLFDALAPLVTCDEGYSA